MHFSKFFRVGVLVLCAHFAASASAAVIVFQSPANSTFSGLPVDAQATFTTSANQVQIVLQNLQANPKSVTQALSGIQFTVASGQTSGTISSSSGIERSISGTHAGDVSNGSAQPTQWALSTAGSIFTISVLGTPEAPNHTIIGPADATGAYSNANSSITGSSHNPFLGESATFTLSVPGMTSASTISASTFQFNTSPGSTLVANNVPEPAAMTLLGSIGLMAIRRRK
jgi:hypothetical protein